MLSSKAVISATSHNSTPSGTKSDKHMQQNVSSNTSPTITLIAALSVSPAAARYSYHEKQAF